MAGEAPASRRPRLGSRRSSATEESRRTRPRCAPHAPRPGRPWAGGAGSVRRPAAARAAPARPRAAGGAPRARAARRCATSPRSCALRPRPRPAPGDSAACPGSSARGGEPRAARERARGAVRRGGGGTCGGAPGAGSPARDGVLVRTKSGDPFGRGTPPERLSAGEVGPRDASGWGSVRPGATARGDEPPPRPLGSPAEPGARSRASPGRSLAPLAPPEAPRRQWLQGRAVSGDDSPGERLLPAPASGAAPRAPRRGDLARRGSARERREWTRRVHLVREEGRGVSS